MGMIFRFSVARGCGVCFSLESPHRCDSAEYRRYNFFKNSLYIIYNLQDYVRSAAVRFFSPSDSGVIANQPW